VYAYNLTLAAGLRSTALAAGFKLPAKQKTINKRKEIAAK
jgi:hypothetical protein